jgi:hydrogenase nickel incorporation protein HypA/HybF
VVAVHELSICRSISGIVTEHAAGRPVARIHVRVGQLRQIVPDTLAHCWELVAATPGSPLAGSVLEVDSVPAGVDCRACGAHTVLTEPVPRCAACGGCEVAIVTGEEFLVTSLDLAPVGARAEA